jgi:hypothetical protein
MNSRSLVLGLTIATGLSSPNAFACGDKFLLLGRSIRYEEAYAAKHPASVLLYLEPSTGFAKVGQEVFKVLQKAGHKPLAVETKAELEKAFKSATFDVVFTDMADLEAMSADVAAAGSHAVVLAVIYAASETEKKTAGKKYSCLLPAKGKDRHFLAVVNEVMRLRAKGREPDCTKS